MIGTDRELHAAPGSDLRADLFRQEYPGMVGMASLLMGSREAAEDVVQEAFLRVFARWPKVDEARAGAYLRTTVLNVARGRLRRDRVAGGRHRSLRVVGTDAEEEAVAGAEQARVLRALATLPQRQRECAVLRYYLDYSEPEIATALGVATGSVKSHLNRARAALENALEEQR